MKRPRCPFCSALRSSDDANPVLPTPVGPIKTMFSAFATNSISAKARICFCETPGCFLKGKDSSAHFSGNFARSMRQARAFCWA
jgi:hypothetical protein